MEEESTVSAIPLIYVHRTTIVMIYFFPKGRSRGMGFVLQGSVTGLLSRGNSKHKLF